MPIAPEVTQVPTDYKPHPVVPQPYQSVTIDAKVIRPDQLLTNIAGSSIVGTYYRQVLGADDDLSGQVQYRDGVLQQYIKIEQFEGKVQDDTKFTQEQVSRRMEGQLSMDTYPTGVYPNVGDRYVTAGLSGTVFIYRVSSSERLSIYNGACYRLELVPVGHANGYMLEDLESKVVETRIFVKSFLQYGENPVINKGDFESLLELASLRKMMLNDYFSRFFSQRFSTCLLPMQVDSTYDSYIVDFIKATMELSDHPLIFKVHSYHTGNLSHQYFSSILQCLVNPEITTRANIFTMAHKVPVRYTGSVIPLYALRTTAIGCVVYPNDAVYNVDEGFGRVPTETYQIYGKADRLPVPSTVKTRTRADEVEPPFILPATNEYDYIFSRDFYAGKPSSLLEEQVESYLNKRPLNMMILTALANSSRYWDNMDKFYYVPIIALLIKKITRSL